MGAAGGSDSLEKPRRSNTSSSLLVGGLQNMCEDVIGHGRGRTFVPFIAGLTFFIFISNIFGLLFFLQRPRPTPAPPLRCR